MEGAEKHRERREESVTEADIREQKGLRVDGQSAELHEDKAVQAQNSVTEKTEAEPQEVTTDDTASKARRVISYLGPLSSYTSQAAMTIGHHDGQENKYLGLKTIEDVFDSVQSGEATFGVVPFENSTNGAVIYTLELLCDRHNAHGNVMICGETYLDVSHTLLGKKDANTTTLSPILSGTCTPTMSTPTPAKPRTQPLHSIGHIKRLYSHPQAWGQCDIFLSTYLRHVERLDCDSTSKAAELAQADETGTSAAIASKLAAQVHGLDILAKAIEDSEDNTTRFFILRKGVDSEAGKGHYTKSMVSFKVDHSTPGGLASVLQCFQKNNLNLTSINSRPTKLIPFQYIFFIEFQGSLHRDTNGRVSAAIKALEEHAESWRWLGSWNDKLLGNKAPLLVESN